MSSKRKEFNIIMGVWAGMFATPVIYLLFVLRPSGFDEHEMLNVWQILLPFFILFMFHHYVMVPYLWDKRRFHRYALTFLIVLALFIIYQSTTMPNRGGFQRPFDSEKRMLVNRPPFVDKTWRPEYIPLRAPYIGRLLTAIMLMGFDIGLSYMVKSSRERHHLHRLENERVKMELELLKYQLNPHFFMNVLNSIHALIDIDTKKAQTAVINLSNLLRYVLYESSTEMVPLEKEVKFLSQYISLMQMRCSNKVDIVFNTPTETEGIEIPPLMLICFIENAFKHGISNRRKSFVHADIAVSEDRENLMFMCSNSDYDTKTVDDHKGIGLKNVRKRLNLIYRNEYTLHITNNDNKFDVCLQIPARKPL